MCVCVCAVVRMRCSEEKNASERQNENKGELRGQRALASDEGLLGVLHSLKIFFKARTFRIVAQGARISIERPTNPLFSFQSFIIGVGGGGAFHAKKGEYRTLVGWTQHYRPPIPPTQQAGAFCDTTHRDAGQEQRRQLVREAFPRSCGQHQQGGQAPHRTVDPPLLPLAEPLVPENSPQGRRRRERLVRVTSISTIVVVAAIRSCSPPPPLPGFPLGSTPTTTATVIIVIVILRAAAIAVAIEIFACGDYRRGFRPGAAAVVAQNVTAAELSALVAFRSPAPARSEEGVVHKLWSGGERAVLFAVWRRVLFVGAGVGSLGRAAGRGRRRGYEVGRSKQWTTARDEGRKLKRGPGRWRETEREGRETKTCKRCVQYLVGVRCEHKQRRSCHPLVWRSVEE